MWKLIAGGIMMSTLIHGTNADGCRSEAESMAQMRAAREKLSDACKAAVSESEAEDSREASACPATHNVCGLLVHLNIAFTCTGDACAQVPQSVLAAQSQTVPTQTCFPKVCNNDADMAVFSGVTEEGMQDTICSNSDEAMKTAVPQVSVQVIVTASKPVQMTCDKNSDGVLEIDGVVIPNPPTDDMHQSEHSGGSMETCGDVKAAYKAAKCCGQPSKPFSMGRRLSNEQTEEELLESLKSALREAEAEGGSSKARSLAESIDAIVAKHF